MIGSRGGGRWRCLIAAMGALAAWAVAPEARAAGGAVEHPRDLEATARAHHQRGESLYVAEQYPQALGEFEAGFAVLPLPGFLVNIGQCQRRMGDLVRARAAFERFLAMAPDSPLASEVRTLIRELVLTPPPLAPFVPAPAPPEAALVVAPAVPVAVAAAPSPAIAALPAPVPARVPAASASEAVGNQVRAAPQSPAPVRRGRPPAISWWLWGGVAVTVAVVAAVVMGAGSGGTTTTIHDGSLGTLRR